MDKYKATNFENKIGKYLLVKRYNIIATIIISILIFIFSNLPYVNAVMSDELVFFLICATAAIILDISSKYIYIIVLIGFILCFLLFTVEALSTMSALSYLLYGFLFIGVLKSIRELYKD